MKKAIVITILVLFGALTVAPLVFLACGSLMGSGELAEYLAPVLESIRRCEIWWSFVSILRNFFRCSGIR